MRRLLPLFALFALAALFGAARPLSPTSAESLIVQTDMFGVQQVPPVDSVAWGFVRFFFDEDRSAADYTVDVKGLSGSLVLGADIHRGPPGSNGPVVFHLADAGFLTASGRISFSASDLSEMTAGEWYVSLKSTSNPAGELRGQILLPDGFLPAQEPPPEAPVIAPPAAPPTSERLGLRITPPNTGSGGLRP